MSSPSTSSDGFSLFDRFIHNNFEICQNCFSRTHTTHVEYDPLDLRKSLRGVVTGDVERHRPTTETDHPPGYEATTKRTICGECGSDRRTILKRPVSKDLAVIYAHRLSERVEEDDELSLDGDLVEEIKRLKSEGTHTSDGNQLYQQAFDASVDLKVEG